METLDSVKDRLELELLEVLLRQREKRLEFAMEHHVNSHGRKMQYKEYPHLHDVYNTVAREWTLMGSVQSLKSEALVIDQLACAAVGLAVFVVLPKVEARGTYVQNRIDNVISNVAHYRSLLVSSNIALKRFGEGSLRYVGSNVADDFKEYPADCCKGSTPVLLTDGRRIPIRQIVAGDEVVSVGGNGRLTTDTVVVCWTVGKRHLFSVECGGSFKLDCTLGTMLRTESGWRYLYELLPEKYYEHNDADGSVKPSAAVANVFRLVPSFGGCPTKVLTQTGDWLDITAVTYAGVDEAWDIQTERHHSFIAGGMVVHNCMVVEEVDECNQDNVELANDRLRGSPFQLKRFVGNPRTPGRGIHKKFLDSTQHRWHVECENCKEVNLLDWFETVVVPTFDKDGMPVAFDLMDEGWSEGTPLRTICPACGLPFNRFSGGLWVPKNADQPKEGRHLHMMMTKLNPLAEMYTLFRDAIGDPAAMQHFYNSCLGLPFAGYGQRLTVKLLEAAAAREKYLMDITDGNAHRDPNTLDNMCSMGVDVGKFFDVKISELMPDGTRVPAFIGKVESKSELVRLGIRYNVEVAVIDSMPETRVAQEFQDEAPFYVWLCQYGSEGTKARMKRSAKDMVVTVDRTTILDKTLAELKLGRSLMPVNFRAIYDGSFIEEMISSTREAQTDTKGNTRFVWTKTKDHSRHADAYDYIAASFMGTLAASSLQVSIG